MNAIRWAATARALRVVLGLVVALVSVRVALADTLWEVYRLSVRNDPALRAVDANRRAVIESRNQNVAVLLPSLSLDADVSRVYQDVDTDTVLQSRGTFARRNIGLGLTQPVYRRDRWLRLVQADSRIAEAEATYLAAVQDLIVRVTERYTEVLAAIDNQEFVRAEKAAVKRQLDQATQRFEVGLIAIIDVQDAQASYDLAVAEEIRAENLLDNAYDALAEITGERIEDLPFLFKEVPLVRPDPSDIDEWVETAMEQNPSFAASRAATSTARQEVEVQRSDHFPTLDLFGRAELNKTTGGAFENRTVQEASIGLELNVPLYQGGLIRSQVREAVQRLEESRDREEQQRRAVVRQTRDGYLGVISSISRVRALVQRLVSTESALEATEAGYEVGTRTIVDVLDAQGNRLESRRDLARERYDYILNGLRLKQAAGVLTDEDVQQVSRWLQE